jgi:ribA/ribD-fused uncharacterized protein
MDELLTLELEGGLPQFLCFWSHTPKESSPVGPWVLSQWWPTRFRVGDTDYCHAEGFIMAAKARLFGDDTALEKILQADDSAVAKHLGQLVNNFDEATWVARRYELVVEGNLAKFSQDSLLATYLCSTSPQVLVEASPRDLIWGIGLGATDPRAAVPSEWRGTNLLGFALTEVREQILSG